MYAGYGNITATFEIPEQIGQPLKQLENLNIRPNEHHFSSERSGLFFDPRYANHIYTGSGNKIFKSLDAGQTFQEIFAFPDETGKVYEIEISRSNHDLMYCVYRDNGVVWSGASLWKSENGGHYWVQLPQPTTAQRRFRISINPEDENEVWVAGTTSANWAAPKVFSTMDGGNTWTNRTTSLLSTVRCTDILFQGGTDNTVYLTTSNQVYYWDGASWLTYSNGLPLISKSMQIDPFYRDAELRLGTKGRGVWGVKLVDTLFRPIAQPITYTDKVMCARDTVQFDCYSILKHEGATWSWTFDPEPQYVSSYYTRNPKVVFGNTGSYDVSLTVTDAQGNTDTKSIDNMVTMERPCLPDGFPGYALECLPNQNSYALVDDIDNLSNKNTLTFSAWIFPKANQNIYSSLIADENNKSLFGFKGGGLLTYVWNNQNWNWNGGPTVELNKWSHVALVVEPNKATIYVNGVPTVNHITHEPLIFETMRIGNFENWNIRNFDGLIDELCIWDKALSQEEIRELRHLTRTGVNPFTDGMISYYQFNENNTIYGEDKVGFNHIEYVNAGTVISTAPVGHGTSDRIFADTNSDFNCTSTETTLSFTNENPNGELVITRLDNLPNSSPDSLLTDDFSVPHDWIVNNYGITDTVNIDSLILRPSSDVVNYISDAKLYSRSENEHINNWIEHCSDSSVVISEYAFGATCDLPSHGQFFIQGLSHETLNIDGIDTDINIEDLNVYPNPINDKLNIQYSNPMDQLILYSLLGQKIYNVRPNEDKFELNTSTLESGTYLLKIVSGDKSKIVKVIKSLL